MREARHWRQTGPGLLGRLRTRDPGLAATRRAARAAVVLPAVVAVCSNVIGSPTVTTFAAFGIFSMLLLVKFTDPMPLRIRSRAALALAWVVLICFGTLVSTRAWLATLSMFLVGFLVLFSGVVSSALAGARTVLLLAFILPVTLPAPLGELPERLAGAALAAGATMLASAFLWPRAPVEPLRQPTIDTCRALAAHLRAEAAHLRDGPGTPATAPTAARAAESIHRLRDVFESTPHRPTGLSTGARALVRLVDELTWMDLIARGGRQPAEGGPGICAAPVAVENETATIMDLAAGLLENPHAGPDGLARAVERLRGHLEVLEEAAAAQLPVYRRTARTHGAEDTDERLSSLDPSFRAQQLGFVVLRIASDVGLYAAAERRTWTQRLLGTEVGRLTDPLRSARERALAHVERNSVWMHNSLRGAAGLALAVAAADFTGVDQSFWVVLATLSVLQSNALNTGQSALRGLTGTALGALVGVGLIQLLGQHGFLLWILLPVAVFAAGFAPGAVSFAAGQAAFAVTLVILYNIGRPTGWQVGLTRVEDVALGCGIGVAVGLLLWPRGAAAALGTALAAAYRHSAGFLTSAVEYGVSRCATGRFPVASPADRQREAAAAARRLDDAFRSYLAERGPKPVPPAEMSALVTGVVALRLAGDAVLSMWLRQGDPHDGEDRTAAQHELLTSADQLSAWYSGLADSLEGARPVPEPLPYDVQADNRLVKAVRRDLYNERARTTAVRVIWTGDHLATARDRQSALTAAARRVSGGYGTGRKRPPLVRRGGTGPEW